jgi:Flp pilus assembly protein TadD
MAIATDCNSRRRIAARGAWALAAVLALAGAGPAAAQSAAPPPGQPVAPPALENLNSALDDLTKAPSDVSALLRAGWASLNLADTQAALGFFRRAEQVAPTNGEAKAGEASALLRLDDPLRAVTQFAAAEAAGLPMARYGSDRGLALDLVGQNVAAQRYYRQALAVANDPETVRRLALSQAIMGDERGAEATLLPLLQQRDLAAYRTRAFALAILGKGEEAVSIAETMLPASLSNRMAAYLRYMPRLTRAQQAAAANLGQFPPASEIGRDSAQIAALSAQNPRPQLAEAGPDSRLVPAGQPLGRSSRSSNDRREERRQKADKKKNKQATQLAAAATPAPQASLPVPPPPTVRAAVQQQPLPSPAPQQTPAPPPAAARPAVVQAAAQQAPTPQPVAPRTPPQQAVSAPPSAAPAPTPPPQTTSAPVVLASAQPPGPAPAPEQPAPSQPVVVARLDTTAPSPQSASEPAPRPSLSITPPASAPAAARPVSLADAFAEFTKDIPAPAAKPGAVDITRIQPARPAAKAEAKAPAKAEAKPSVKAKPKPPASPSRVWVQVGTGRDVKALAFTWKRLQKEGGALLAKHNAYSAKWGDTRRLVTGPYKSEDDAQDAVKALKKKGLDAFEFTSDEGEEVTALK